MKKKFILFALFGATSHFASAAVHFTYAKQQASSAPSTRASNRRRSDGANISYHGATYVVNVTVGTPGQAMTLELSTSLSDTFVLDARSSRCTSEYEYYDYSDEEASYRTSSNLCIWGSFSPGNSSSFTLADTVSSNNYDDDDDDDDDDDYPSNEGEFIASYNDGSSAYGDYMRDTLTIEGMTISNLTMGLVNETDTPMGTPAYMGVLGIGYNDSNSDNLPDRLLEQGFINTTAYSIWVDDDTAAAGNLLFGAIDTTKFTGNLTRLRSSYSYVDMMVQVVGINGTTKSGGPIAITINTDEESSSGAVTSETHGDSYLFTAIFSPPDTISTVPSDVASQMWEMAGAYYQQELELALIGCSAVSDTTTHFTIQLGGQGADGPIITAYMSDLVIPASEYNLSTEASLYVDLGDDVCLFGVQNASTIGYSYSSSSQFNLGSTMLRRTYSVFDLANSEVAVAPVVFGASATSNIVPFSSYGAIVPQSTVICYYSDCYADRGSGSSDSTDSEGGDSSLRLPGLLSLGALLGLTLGLGVGCFGLGLAGFLVWRHRRNKKLAMKKEEEVSVSSAKAVQRAPEMSTTFAAARGSLAAPAPTTAPPAPPAPEHVDEGKRPESAPPLPSRPVEGEARSSGAEASTARGSQNEGHDP